MNRFATITEKVPTDFGNLYAHVGHDESGCVQEVAFSSPGKFQDSEVDRALKGLERAINAILLRLHISKVGRLDE